MDVSLLNGKQCLVYHEVGAVVPECKCSLLNSLQNVKTCLQSAIFEILEQAEDKVGGSWERMFFLRFFWLVFLLLCCHIDKAVLNLIEPWFSDIGSGLNCRIYWGLFIVLNIEVGCLSLAGTNPITFYTEKLFLLQLSHTYQ